MVFPWPGVKAWAAPRPKAASMARRTTGKVSSRRCRIRDRKSPRTTDPGGAAWAVRVTGEEAPRTGVGCAMLATTVLAGVPAVGTARLSKDRVATTG